MHYCDLPMSLRDFLYIVYVHVYAYTHVLCAFLLSALRRQLGVAPAQRNSALLFVIFQFFSFRMGEYSKHA